MLLKVRSTSCVRWCSRVAAVSICCLMSWVRAAMSGLSTGVSDSAMPKRKFQIIISLYLRDETPEVQVLARPRTEKD